MNKAKLPSPDTLNKGFIIGLNILPKIEGIFVWERSSVAIKNGKSEGTIEFAHNFKPDFAALILLDEKANKQIVNIRNVIENIFRFILKTKILIFFIWNTSFAVC